MDVEKEQKKTELMKKIVDNLQKVEGIVDVTKMQYVSVGEKVKSELELVE